MCRLFQALYVPELFLLVLLLFIILKLLIIIIIILLLFIRTLSSPSHTLFPAMLIVVWSLTARTSLARVHWHRHSHRTLSDSIALLAIAVLLLLLVVESAHIYHTNIRRIKRIYQGRVCVCESICYYSLLYYTIVMVCMQVVHTHN